VVSTLVDMSALLWRLAAISFAVAICGQPDPPPVFTCLSGQDAECATLRDLYYSTGGPSWTNTIGWADAAAGNVTDVCSFFGVDCSVSRVVNWGDYSFSSSTSTTSSTGGGGRVTSLCARARALRHSFSSSLLLTCGASCRSLTYNGLDGPLPDTWAGLASLTLLYACLLRTH